MGVSVNLNNIVKTLSLKTSICKLFQTKLCQRRQFVIYGLLKCCSKSAVFEYEEAPCASIVFMYIYNFWNKSQFLLEQRVYEYKLTFKHLHCNLLSLWTRSISPFSSIFALFFISVVVVELREKCGFSPSLRSSPPPWSPPTWLSSLRWPPPVGNVFLLPVCLRQSQKLPHGWSFGVRGARVPWIKVLI